MHKCCLPQEPQTLFNTLCSKSIMQMNHSLRWLPGDHLQPPEIHVFLNLLVHLKVWQVLMALINIVLQHISSLNREIRRDQGNLRGKCKAKTHILTFSWERGGKRKGKDEDPCKVRKGIKQFPYYTLSQSPLRYTKPHWNECVDNSARAPTWALLNNFPEVSQQKRLLRAQGPALS